MWKLSIEDDQGEKTSVNLVRDEYTVGRAEKNTIRLTERNISREHARLFKEGDDWYIADFDSYNGAYVNGARVVDPVRVSHGDLIQLGDYRLEVVDEALAATRTHPTVRDGLLTTTGRRDTLVNQPDRFVMVVGPAPGTEYPLTGDRMVVGRGEECDISINHASVSRVHAEVHTVGSGRYELIDKGSANGVRVNAVEMQRALIDARDNIELGDVILKFVPAGDIYVPGADEAQTLAAGQVAADAFSLSAQPTTGSSRLPVAVKAGIALLGVGVLAVLILLVSSPRNATPPVQSVTREQPEKPMKSPDQLTLEAAERLLKEGDVFGAHAKLLELSADSPQKRSSAFRKIEGSWADSLMEAAETETDPEAKRGLLDQVTRSPGVDKQRRQRASDLLAAMNAETMEIDELPESKSSASPPAAQPRSLSQKPRLQRPQQPAVRKPPPPPPTTVESAPTLVREDPFGSAPNE